MVSYVEHPHDTVRVIADFQPENKPQTGDVRYRKIRPLTFFWAGKRYDVQSVNLVYKRKIGTHDAWCFAVSDHANTFVLSYTPDLLQWSLDEIQGK